MKKKPVIQEYKPIEFPRADLKALVEFDPRTKRCSMNCGPHRQDTRSDKERLFLCGDCYTIPKEEIE